MDDNHARHTLPVQQEKALLQKRDRRRTLLFRWATAASILFILALCVYGWLQPRPPRSKIYLQPASIGARMTRPDSTVINFRAPLVLPKAFLTQAGQYQFTTARGQYFWLVLPDHSTVWLNANSSLKYPSDFADSQRQVELVGEAYFEVHPDPKRPFTVLLPDEAKVKAHDAKFNIYAYTDDAGFLTSLIEGSAEMDAGRIDKVPLRPGQAASYWRLKELTLDTAVDPASALAWKNNVFVLDHKVIYPVLKDIGNWYDATIKDDKDAKYDTTHLSGIVPRTAPVTDLLKVIERQTHFRFTIDGNTITVIKSDDIPPK